MTAKKVWWSLRGDSDIAMQYYYPMQADFDFPDVGDNAHIIQPGTLVPFAAEIATSIISEDGVKAFFKSDPQAVTWHVAWPEHIPELKIGQTHTIAKDGLPDIWSQNSVQLISVQDGRTMSHQNDNDIATLVSPTERRIINLPSDTAVVYPDTQPLTVFGFTYSGKGADLTQRHGKVYFLNLHPILPIASTSTHPLAAKAHSLSSASWHRGILLSHTCS